MVCGSKVKLEKDGDEFDERKQFLATKKALNDKTPNINKLKPQNGTGKSKC